MKPPVSELGFERDAAECFRYPECWSIAAVPAENFSKFIVEMCAL